MARSTWYLTYHKPSFSIADTAFDELSKNCISHTPTFNSSFTFKPSFLWDENGGEKKKKKIRKKVASPHHDTLSCCRFHLCIIWTTSLFSSLKYFLIEIKTERNSLCWIGWRSPLQPFPWFLSHNQNPRGHHAYDACMFIWVFVFYGTKVK